MKDHKLRNWNKINAVTDEDKVKQLFVSSDYKFEVDMNIAIYSRNIDVFHLLIFPDRFDGRLNIDPELQKIIECYKGRKKNNENLTAFFNNEAIKFVWHRSKHSFMKSEKFKEWVKSLKEIPRGVECIKN